MRNVVAAMVAAMLLACGAFGQKTVPAAQNCERLPQLELPGAKIDSAQTIAAGAFPGEIGYFGLGLTVQKGYAAVGTDTGHSAGGTDASWALGHPEKVTDYGYRGIHEMTRIAKAVIQAFYGKSPQHSYFGGCSNGG